MLKSSRSEPHQKVTEAILCSGKKTVEESVRESQVCIKEGDSMLLQFVTDSGDKTTRLYKEEALVSFHFSVRKHKIVRF